MAAEKQAKEVKEKAVGQTKDAEKPAKKAEVKVAKPADTKAAKPAEGAEVRKPRRPAPRRKVCQFCVDKVEFIDYKDVAKIRKFVTENGKIIPSRQTGTCSKHQRDLTTAIKRARYMGLLHYKGE